MKRTLCLLIALLLLCGTASCGTKSAQGKEPSTDTAIEDGDNSEEEAANVKSTADGTLRKFTFDSGEAVESLSDEDFLYIVENYRYYEPSDFIDDFEKREIDLFGVPLDEWVEDGITYHEQVSTMPPDMRLPYDEVNLDERIPEDELREFVEKDCQNLIDAQNRDNTRTDKGEIIFCGEDDDWLEYSIRFKVYRTYGNNGIMVSDVSRWEHRRLYSKNRITVSQGDSLFNVYLGEYTLEKMKQESDFGLSNGAKLLYREFDETEDELIKICYDIDFCYGDYGLSDTATLVKTTSTYDKKKHTWSSWNEYIKKDDIPGTYHEYDWD